MPELPEVETIRRHLAPHVEGRTLRRLEILDPRWCEPIAPAELAAATEGRAVERLGRRGKYLIWELEGDVFLLVHLRMTGTLLLDPPGDPLYTRVWLDVGEHRLAFADPRRFGTGELAIGPDALDAFLRARLGLEPLHPEFTSAHLYALARTSRAPIKAFLLDQKRIAGVGNIYADEALFRARIHPLRPAGTLATDEVRRLHRAARRALQLGIERQGATLRDYAMPDGERGAVQREFRVYGRAGESCDRCGTPIEKTRAAGRGTWFCPNCQR